MREILVNRADPREIAVMENGHLCEYLTDEPSAGLRTGDLVLGRVERVIAGMDAAFVQIGAERNGFLPLKEKSDSFQGETRLKTGDRVLVQVIREAHGEKGAFLTRDCTVKGVYVMLMPMNRFIGASAKLDSVTADRLRDFGRAAAENRFGLIMRTACQDADPRDVSDEINRLWENWQRIAHDAATAAVGAVLSTDAGSVLTELLKDYIPRGVDAVVSDDPAVETIVNSACPFSLVDSDPLATAGVPAKLEDALRRRVWLKSGANIVIDECEALTVIDVNTAKFTGKRNIERNLTQVNREACEEIARQVRLRAYGGIIVIDMIDMTDEEDREAVLASLREAFANDREKTVVHGFTHLGLIEMTRRRTRIPLREMMKRRENIKPES